MRNELNYLEIITKYINGELNAKQTADFEAKLNTSEQLRTDLELQQNLIDGIRQASIKTQIQQAGKRFKTIRNVRNWGLGLGVAGALTIGVLQIDFYAPGEMTKEERVDNTETRIGPDFSNSTDHFLINNATEQLVESSQGGLYIIPDSAFEDEDGNLVLEDIEIDIDEFLEAEDIIMAGLSTMNNDSLLETGGMFELTPSKDGKPLQLRAGKAIDVSIPTDEKLAGMQLYDGEKLENGSVNWINPVPLDNYLTPIDMAALNFYPPNYLDSLRGMKQAYENKKFTDSLYVSFAKEFEGESSGHNDLYVISQKGEIPSRNITVEEAFKLWSGLPENSSTEIIEKWISTTNFSFGDSSLNKSTAYKLGMIQIDTIARSNTNKLYSFKGINPSTVLAVWNKNYNNTLLSTKEFETRMAAIHPTCNQSVFNLYKNNLKLNLWEVDEKASRLLSGKEKARFKAFAARKDGKVTIDDQRIQTLTAFFSKKQKALDEASKKAEKKLQKEWTQIKNDLQKSSSEKTQRDVAAYQKNLQKETDINLKKAFKDLGLPTRNVTTSMAVANNKPKPVFPKKAFYRARVTSLGIKNIDRLTREATLARQTLNFSKNGKSTQIVYDPCEVTVQGEFDKTDVYLLPKELYSFQKMKFSNGKYNEKLNSLLSYDLVVIGYKGDETFMAVEGDISAKNYSIKPVSISKEDLKKVLRKYNGRAGKDIAADVAHQQLQSEFRVFEGRYMKKRALEKRIRPVIFPCAEKIDYGGDVEEWIGPAEANKVENQLNAGPALGASLISEPTFPGGMDAAYDFLYQIISYPSDAKNSGIEGTVYISFIVDELGNLIKPKIEQGIGGGCDEAALQAVRQMPKWIPADNNGGPIRQRLRLPIKFELN